MAVAEENIKLARFLAQAIGSEPRVHAYYDDDKQQKLDLLSLTAPVDSEVGIYCTIGLSDYPNMVEVNNGEKRNIPIEFIFTASKAYEKVPNILAACAFYIMKDKYECRPGTIFIGIPQFYYPELSMKHIYFTEPFLWQDELEHLKLDSKKVTFLLCLPISEEELQYKLKYGDEALETLFEDNEIDVYDLNRASVL